MAKKKRAYIPSMANAAVAARTGKNWSGWFATLDKAGAAKLDHKSIVQMLSRQQGVSGWWAQMVTVEYERARGLRERHETAQGFSVSVSKTVAAGLPALYGAVASAAKRKRWWPQGSFVPSSQTKNKYFRGSWNGSARLEMGFYAEGEGKAQIAVQVNKLAKGADVERERKMWKAALENLRVMLEGG